MIKYFIPILLYCTIIHADECNLSNPKSVFRPRYSKNFSIHYYQDFKLIKSGDFNYIIGEKINDIIKKCNNVIFFNKGPQRIALSSTSFIPAVEKINKAHLIFAFQGKQYIYSNAVNKNSISNFGFEFKVEEALSSKIDTAFLYKENIKNPNLIDVAKKLGINIVFINDHLEINPLARAEWMIFEAAFWGEEKKLIEHLQAVEKRYFEVKNSPVKLKKVLVGYIQNGLWVSPGGKSDFSTILKDAGATLIFDSNSEKTNYISLEEVAIKSKEASIWILNGGVRKRSDLPNHYIYQNLRPLPAFNYVGKLSGAANDYWESGVMSPDRLILNLRQIIENGKGDGWYTRI